MDEVVFKIERKSPRSKFFVVREYAQHPLDGTRILKWTSSDFKTRDEAAAFCLRRDSEKAQQKRGSE